MKQPLILAALLAFSAHLAASDLTITVTNIKQLQGNIIIGIFDDAREFPEGKPIQRLSIPADECSVTTVVKQLSEGEYAIAVLHDANGNGKCEKNMLGIPKEGFGFSNNYKPRIKAPSFSNVKFNINGGVSMSIKLLYF